MNSKTTIALAAILLMAMFSLYPYLSDGVEDVVKNMHMTIPQKLIVEP